MSFRHLLTLFASGLALAGPARADERPRAELPIRQVDLPNGARRFAVPITVGGTRIEAGLDTGSVGLRILPGTLKGGDAKPTQVPDQVRYGSGALLEGVVATGTLDVAGIKGDASFQMVEQVGCTARRPDCPAAKVSQADYGVMGNGIAGAGFKAILGLGPKQANIDNPFRRLGIARFIVELPRDKDETGRIILNPSPSDVEGFTEIPAYQRSAAQTQLPDDAVSGCLTAATGAKICGALTFDTGAPGIRIVSPDDLGEAWPDGTKAAMVLDDGTGKALVTDDIVVGSRDEAAHLKFQQMRFLPKTIIRAGIAPYLAYSVLYDLDKGGLSVKPRQAR